MARKAPRRGVRGRQDGMGAEIMDEPLSHGFPGLSCRPDSGQCRRRARTTRRMMVIPLQEPDDLPRRPMQRGETGISARVPVSGSMPLLDECIRVQCPAHHPEQQSLRRCPRSSLVPAELWPRGLSCNVWTAAAPGRHSVCEPGPLGRLSHNALDSWKLPTPDRRSIACPVNFMQAALRQF